MPARTNVLYNNPVKIATYLTDKFRTNDFEEARSSLGAVVRAQNVQMLARDAGIRRDTLYRTFGGRTDPQLSRIVKLFDGLNVQASVAAVSGENPPLHAASSLIAERLSRALSSNDPDKAVIALSEAALSQSVSALARASGIPRRTIYKTFGGAVDPNLSRVLQLLAAMQLRLVIAPHPPRPRTPWPKLGRPPKASRKTSLDE